MEMRAPKKRLGSVKHVESYDFRQPKLFSKEIMRTLRTIHDVLSRNLNRIFSSTLRYKVEISLSKIVQFSSHDFVQNIENPSAIYLLKVNEMGGEIIIVMPAEFCIHLIERQSGGQGKSLSEKRKLTIIEEKIVNRVVRHINNEIISAWEPYMDFQIDSMIYESKTENLHLTSVDPTIIVKFKVDLGEQQLEIGVSYPYSLLKKAMSDTIMKKGMKSREERLQGEELESYKRTLEKATVRIQPLLGTTKLTLQEIINLKEGDALPLNQKSEDPLEIRVNGATKMKGYPGVKQGRRAIKVFEILEEINETELV